MTKFLARGPLNRPVVRWSAGAASVAAVVGVIALLPADGPDATTTGPAAQAGRPTGSTAAVPPLADVTYDPAPGVSATTASPAASAATQAPGAHVTTGPVPAVTVTPGWPGATPTRPANPTPTGPVKITPTSVAPSSIVTVQPTIIWPSGSPKPTTAPTAQPTEEPSAPLPTFPPTDDPSGSQSPTGIPEPTDLPQFPKFRYNYVVDVCRTLDPAGLQADLALTKLETFTAEQTMPGSCLLVDDQQNPVHQVSVVLHPADSPYVKRDTNFGTDATPAGFDGTVRRLPSGTDTISVLAVRKDYAAYVQIVTVAGHAPASGKTVQGIAVTLADGQLSWLTETAPAHPKFPDGSGPMVQDDSATTQAVLVAGAVGVPSIGAALLGLTLLRRRRWFTRR
jgi:hypothetical protein